MGRKNKGKRKDRPQAVMTYSGTGWGAKKCTHEDRGLCEVFKLGKATIWAGAYTDVNDALDKGLKIDLVLCVGGPMVYNRLTDDIVLAFKGSARQLLPTVAKTVTPQAPAVLVIDWPDGRDPPCSAGWWKVLYADLAAIEGNVAVCCWGGHGRTGTTLAILAHMTGVAGKRDVVAWLRETYCNEAVETTAQIDYLVKECKIPTTVGHSRNTSVVTAPNFYKRWDTPAESGAVEAEVVTVIPCALCSSIESKYYAEVEINLCEDCARVERVQDSDVAAAVAESYGRWD